MNELARRPTLFMQIIEYKRAVFFDDRTANVVTPGITTRIAAARHVVVRQLFIVLRQHVLIDRLVAVFMHDHRRRQTRLHIRVISGPA